ncbi:hypothetical protein BREVUG8_100597 [Brevundimonas sp. G8]|nr:hypothetical protein BREVUG8_100597 [Brevundimonas sp. G8]
MPERFRGGCAFGVEACFQTPNSPARALDLRHRLWPQVKRSGNKDAWGGLSLRTPVRNPGILKCRL